MQVTQRFAQLLTKNVGSVIVGKESAIELMMIAILCRGHVLIEDVPGVGKTTLASAIARSLDCSFRRIQFTPDITPSDITGFSIANFKTGELEYRPGMIMSQIVLADEINRTSPKTQSALLEVMEEGQVSVDGNTYPMPQPFIVLATQNPVGSAGTMLLPNSQLDRFLIRVSMGYPDFESQISILRDRHTHDPLADVRAVVDREELTDLMEQAAQVEVHDRIYAYVTHLAEATRTHPLVELGVSPRGALAVCRMAKAYALLHGRDFVMPEDVAAIFPDVCTHRLVLSAKARMLEQPADAVLREILDAVDMPVLRER